jgi:hypothetical protein
VHAQLDFRVPSAEQELPRSGLGGAQAKCEPTRSMAAIEQQGSHPVDEPRRCLGRSAVLAQRSHRATDHVLGRLVELGCAHDARRPFEPVDGRRAARARRDMGGDFDAPRLGQTPIGQVGQLLEGWVMLP